MTCSSARDSINTHGVVLASRNNNIPAKLAVALSIVLCLCVPFAILSFQLANPETAGPREPCLKRLSGECIIPGHFRESARMLDISSHDIVLVGGGGAGLRAAIAISERDPKLSVAVVSKVYPMRSHTVAAEGGAAGGYLSGGRLDQHAYETIFRGDWLCDQDSVEAFLKKAPAEVVRPGHWGCPC